MKIGFFEVKDEEAEYIKGKLFGHQLVFSPDPLDDKTLKDEDFDIISIFTDSPVDEAIFKKLPKLQFIATRSTGYDHISLKETEQRNIEVSNVPAYGENTVAEYAFGLLLNLSRKIIKSYEQVKKTGSFDVNDSDILKGFDLMGKTLGVIGSGRIGQHVIRIANGFGMKVLAFDTFQKPELQEQLHFKYVPLDELLAASDVLSVHVPYLSTTHHLINQKNLPNVKKGSILINTARGPVVETEAIIRGLQDGIFSGVGLDVLEEEEFLKDETGEFLEEKPSKEDLKTLLQDHILMGMENVIITPHNAFNTKEAIERILDTTVENIKKFVEGKPQNLVKS